MDREILEGIREVLEKEKRVEFAYLFGSFARRGGRKDSDIDIAVFVRNENLPLNFEQKLALKIEEKIKKQVEIVVMNQASLSLLLEILKHGFVLFSRNEKKRIMFETFKLREIQYYNQIIKEFDKIKYGIR